MSSTVTVIDAHAHLKEGKHQASYNTLLCTCYYWKERRESGQATLPRLAVNQLVLLRCNTSQATVDGDIFYRKNSPSPPGGQIADLRVTWRETPSQDNNNGDFEDFLNSWHIFIEFILLLGGVEQWNKRTLSVNIQRLQCQAFAPLLRVITVQWASIR